MARRASCWANLSTGAGAGLAWRWIMQSSLQRTRTGARASSSLRLRQPRIARKNVPTIRSSCARIPPAAKSPSSIRTARVTRRPLASSKCCTRTWTRTIAASSAVLLAEMRFALLGSGSEGNALVVQVGQTRVLLDCGFSLSETLSRLARLDLQADQLDGIVVTHEHGDHISGVARLARKFDLPVWLTHGTLRAQNAAFAGLSITEIKPHLAFAVGDVQVQPYPVPHDAAEPVQD